MNPTDCWNSDNGREKQRGKQQRMRPQKEILLCLYMLPPSLFLQAGAHTPRQRRRMRISWTKSAYPMFSFHCIVRRWQLFAPVSHPKTVSHFLSVPIFSSHFLPCGCDLSQKHDKSVSLAHLLIRLPPKPFLLLVCMANRMSHARITVKQHLFFKASE